MRVADASYMASQTSGWAFSMAALVVVACSASSGENVGESGNAVTNGTIYNFGALAHPGSCLDAFAAGTTDGTQIEEYQCNGTGAQSFAVVAAANGAVNLLNTNANKCVDIAASGTANGTQVRLWDCNGTAAQTFFLQAAGNGFVNIINTNSNKCLDVQADNPANNTIVQLYDCNGTNAQLWNPAAIGVLSSGSGSGSTTGGGSSSTGLSQCTSAELAKCNCPSTFSCCPTDGSCFQSLDQIVYTMCKDDQAAACSMSGGSTTTGGGSTGGGSTGGGSTGGGSTGTGGSAGGSGTVSTCGASVGAGERVITITNECPGQTISVGVNGGFVQNCDNGACPAGSTCSTSRSPAGCFWDLPQPACGSSVLASGGTSTYILPAAAAGSSIAWSGNIYAATECASNGTGCKTAQCAKSVNGQTVIQDCADGMGPQGPTTLAEFTLVTTGDDFYDVSSINGVNVPVSMGPINATASGYSCGTAGSASGTGGLQACSWSFNPTINGANQSALLRAVAPGGSGCSSDANCGGGEVCGTALSFTSSSASQTCGQQIGWWTADELCAYTGNSLGGAVNCNGGVPGQGTNANLYGCDGANATSGYSTSASGTSCGCPNWNINGQSLPLNPGYECHANNSEWDSVAEPWAAFLKNACPTAYSFPFDDATSTFTCTTPNPSASNPNTTGYAITFCPGGKTGY